MRSHSEQISVLKIRGSSEPVKNKMKLEDNMHHQGFEVPLSFTEGRIFFFPGKQSKLNVSQFLFLIAYVQSYCFQELARWNMIG